MWAWRLQVANFKEERRIVLARAGVFFEEEMEEGVGKELCGITG